MNFSCSKHSSKLGLYFPTLVLFVSIGTDSYLGRTILIFKIVKCLSHLQIMIIFFYLKKKVFLFFSHIMYKIKTGN